MPTTATKIYKKQLLKVKEREMMKKRGGDGGGNYFVRKENV